MYVGFTVDYCSKLVLDISDQIVSYCGEVGTPAELFISKVQ
jgi:hypothetical protein